MDLTICGWPPLGGRGFGLLETVQEINGTLRVGSCLEDRALIVPQCCKPRADVGGMPPHNAQEVIVMRLAWDIDGMAVGLRSENLVRG